LVQQNWAPPSPLLTVPNVTAYPLTASVPITVLLYDGPLLCSFNVAIKGLITDLMPVATATLEVTVHCLPEFLAWLWDS